MTNSRFWLFLSAIAWFLNGAQQATITMIQRAVGCLLALLAVDAGSAVAAEPSAPPNIVLILADDLGWSDIGCYGGEIPTPHLDKLAKNGLRFSQFYNNSVCGPSRAALLTGLYPQRVGHSGANWNQPTDFTRSLTLGEVLQAAGYHTMMVGKWQDPDLPAKRGFHRFYGPMCAGKISYFHEVQLNPFYLDETRVPLADDFYLTEALTDHALQFLQAASVGAKSASQPFFLYVAHIAPHWPLHAREADIEPHRARYRERGWDEWQSIRIERQRQEGLIASSLQPALMPEGVHPWKADPFKEWQAERMAVYAAQVASVDSSTGRILEALRAAGRLDNTLILFLSDNGAAPDGGLKPVDRMLGFAPGLGISQTFRKDGIPIRPGSGPANMPGPPDTFASYGLAWAVMSNTPFRSTKLTGYEGGIRTPLIAHWPSGIRGPGRIVSDVGHVMDVMPTLIELAGASYPRRLQNRLPLPLDGISLAPMLRNELANPRGDLAWRVPQHRVLRSGNWKIISKDGDSPWELYDLDADAGETRDLSNTHPELVNKLVDRWERWAADCARKP